MKPKMLLVILLGLGAVATAAIVLLAMSGPAIGNIYSGIRRCNNPSDIAACATYDAFVGNATSVVVNQQPVAVASFTLLPMPTSDSTSPGLVFLPTGLSLTSAQRSGWQTPSSLRQSRANKVLFGRMSFRPA